jgi:hypothetical protein
MNPRVIVALVGGFTAAIGLAAALYPAPVMHFIGYEVGSNASASFLLGEFRGVYGGLMIAAGVATLLSMPAPRANSGRLMLIAMLWVGVGLGRLFGAFLDGNPGIFGWLSMLIELGGAGLLIFAAQAPDPIVDAGGTAQAAPPLTP